MDEPKGNRFTKYFPLLLDALRSTDPAPLRPAEACAWMRARVDVDRSLAIVDLALRRRFAFVDLEPRFGPRWREWCVKHGLDDTVLDEIEARLGVLNAEISAAVSLGPQFRVGHSYVTP